MVAFFVVRSMTHEVLFRTAIRSYSAALFMQAIALRLLGYPTYGRHWDTTLVKNPASLPIFMLPFA